MYFFIAIIFIAELIVTAFLINLITKADKAVLRLNEQVTQSREDILKALNCVKNSIIYIEKGIDWVLTYVERKREEYLMKLTKKLLTYALIFVLEMALCNSKKCKSVISGIKAVLKRFLA